MARAENDFYPTTQYPIEAFLMHEKFTGNIWEPACGEGDIAKIFLRKGFNVKATDLVDYGFGTPGQDFLKYDGEMVDNIVTNPPFLFGTKFVLQAKRFARHKIAMLFPLSFIGCQERYEMFQDKEFPLKAYYPFSQRISMYADGKKTKNGSKIDFAWYVWDRNHIGKPWIEWIKPYTEIILFEKHISKPKDFK